MFLLFFGGVFCAFWCFFCFSRVSANFFLGFFFGAGMSKTGSSRSALRAAAAGESITPVRAGEFSLERARATTPSAEVQPQGEFGGKLPPVRTNQLNWGWPWPGRGLASCPQFGSFDGRSQGGFEKPALGCIFHRAGPGLPGDMRPGDDDKRNRPQGGFSKPALGCIFHKAGPGLPRGR